MIQRANGGGSFNTYTVPNVKDLDLMQLSFLDVWLQSFSFTHVNVIRFRSLDITSVLRSKASLMLYCSLHVIASQSSHLQN